MGNKKKRGQQESNYTLNLLIIKVIEFDRFAPYPYNYPEIMRMASDLVGHNRRMKHKIQRNYLTFKSTCILIAIGVLSGCANIREYCKDAANPNTCNVKASLGVLACEQEAERKTPIIETRTGGVRCSGGSSGTVSGSYVNISSSSVCSPEIKQTQDKAILDMHFRSCLQAKENDGRFKR